MLLDGDNLGSRTMNFVGTAVAMLVGCAADSSAALGATMNPTAVLANGRGIVRVAGTGSSCRCGCHQKGLLRQRSANACSVDVALTEPAAEVAVAAGAPPPLLLSAGGSTGSTGSMKTCPPTVPLLSRRR